ncbi:ketoacyl-synt-domain-containing protein [Viridothelium virens]|uniref:Ketoacyl-synt-domain-containing protein n=1 Tax=Viridothelium virens TaxID=1048519 RepID=A0A6A6HC73_VIRVR|nr:ketoacyl-synt-domain-containing protein [Viridothelium virens]
MLLTPLVVLTQLTQFWHYLELHYGTVDHGLHVLRNQKAQTLGFCTGLLSAYAVASSFNQDDLERYGAVAIRLATLVGAIVDAYDIDQGRATSFTTAWHTSQQGADLERALAQYPQDAYSSVLYDERKATLTVSERAAPELLSRLRAAGFTTTEVGLRGRFHTTAHQEMLDALLHLADVDLKLQYQNATQLGMLSCTNTDGKPLREGPLYVHALRGILVEQANWYGTLTAACDKTGSNTRIVSFSSQRCIPSSLLRILHPQLLEIGMQASPDAIVSDSSPSQTQSSALPSPADVRNNDIAIVGLSIKVAGADDVDEFSTLLRSGISQHTEVPSSRVPFGTSSTPWRPDPTDGPKRKWYGNFVSDIDAFDHRFFRKSVRESAAMDVQQRLFLQAAYQAVEMAGWFAKAGHEKEEDRKDNVGVYVGTCATDYEHQAACHEPGAFSATGLLRSFIAGKVSHFFGWTGPAMTLDTACSGSAVAIHTACRALLHGECSAALCGGVNTIGTPLWFQNLAGASFLSPSGQCKPFDDLADGYCRGEGIGAVLLKPMKAAIADKDIIFGRISSTTVNQNDNSTPLFVPNAPSLSRLFVDVINDAGLASRDISLVEAHGTGTPVGDPVEYESVRQALAGPIRAEPLPIGSIKGLIGHTESTSGVASLIKVLVLMHEGFIPPQASYSKLSHRIDASPTDMIEIPTSLREWTVGDKAALINNYGASGSNASMVVRQTPYNGQATAAIHNFSRQPFWITGRDRLSIAAYCIRLVQFLKREAKQRSLADIAFNVARQSNRSFTSGLIFSCSSVRELIETLSLSPLPPVDIKPARPVILCFGGQVSTFVGLDHGVYDSVQILRKHLRKCDDTIQSLGLDTIFPELFAKAPIKDTVKLQTMLFALQYACAMCWLDCDVNIKGVVGHSFGEITALCVSGVLSLQDAIKLVAGRAKLIRDVWGLDPGSMMAVEADLIVVQRLLAEANQQCEGGYPASIACYNGPRSFTLAGSAEAMTAVATIISTTAEFASIKNKRLNVTNAFHSTLVEPLLPALEEIGQDLTFNEPTIPLERATETRAATSKLTPKFVPDHMRNPVFFNHALQRLAKDHPSCIWLEAGSSSTITIIAQRALGSAPEMHFQAMNLTSDRGMENLSEATVALWNEGLRFTFWPHHTSQTYEYAPLLLPAYQFEKSRHWLEFMPVTDANLRHLQREEPQIHPDIPLGLWTFTGFEDPDQRRARFRINTGTEKYRSFVLGHVAVQTAPICPATLEIDMAIEALFSLLSDAEAALGLQPIVRDVQNHVALCIDPARAVWLDLEASEKSMWRDCEWKIVTTPLHSDGRAGEMLCVQGRIALRRSEDAGYQMEFGRFERLVSHQACADLLLDAADEADDILKGRNVYRAFSEVVDYGEYYQGVERVVGKGNECVGRVKMRHSSDTWLDVPVLDSCTQVAGLWVNCMTDRPPEDMFLATGCEMIMRSSRDGKAKKPETYNVLARHHRESDKAFLADVFVFDATDGQLVRLILGIRYSKMTKRSMKKILTRLTGDPSVLRSKPDAATVEEAHTGTFGAPSQIEITPEEKMTQPVVVNTSSGSSHPDIRGDLRVLVANVCGLQAEEIEEDREMADYGIDSLMGMELSREVENKFKCKLDLVDLIEATTFRKFVACLSKALYGDDYQRGEESSEDSDACCSNGGATSSERLSETTSASTPPILEDPGMLSYDDQVQEQEKSVAGIPLNGSTIVDLQLSPLDILASFGEVKWSTDKRLQNASLDDTDAVIIARSNRLCVALVIEAFEKLGCPLRTASEGLVLPRIPHQPQHARFVDWLYRFLSIEARVVDLHCGEVTRSSMSAPRKSSEELYHELLRVSDTWLNAHKLAYFAGKHLANVLSGTTDGISVLFASAEGRALVEGLYCDLPYNRLAYEQMCDVIKNLTTKMSRAQQGPLKILEMGAGTGGTTRILAPFLAELNVPVQYTYTDLSPSMVAQARRRFKQYPFMHFAVHDIEKPPAAELTGQHIVLASNAVHATHDLRVSASHIHEALSEDGFLMLTEMTEGIPFVDLVFGLLEGWWLFSDGRSHALVSEKKWEEELQTAGFGHVDWTDGELPENKIQRVVMAMASGPVRSKLPQPQVLRSEERIAPQIEAVREAEAEKYIIKYSAGFDTGGAQSSTPGMKSQSSSSTVLITGGTGSLGAHLVAAFALRSDVCTVICLNRQSNNTLPEARQQEAFTSRGINLPSVAQAKLKVLEIDGAKSDLSLPKETYAYLASNLTHIVHNAWPMSGTRALHGFEPQFAMLRNLIDLAAAAYHHQGKPVTFQLISSIGIVGNHPVDAFDTEVQETRVPLTSVLPLGYCEAKWVCERILDETLHRYPDHFRTMVVRPGQIAGNSTSGCWNPVEHLPFLIKSAQSLQVFPELHGRMQWVPVNEVAGTIVDLAMRGGEVSPVYHIDNPVGQAWEEMVPLLARELGIPEGEGRIIPFDDWVRKVRRSPLSMETDNPALRLIDFLEGNFRRMSCGGLILGTATARLHSATLAALGPISDEVATRYIRAWKATGFLT